MELELSDLKFEIILQKIDDNFGLLRREMKYWQKRGQIMTYRSNALVHRLVKLLKPIFGHRIHFDPLNFILAIQFHGSVRDFCELRPLARKSEIEIGRV